MVSSIVQGTQTLTADGALELKGSMSVDQVKKLVSQYAGPGKKFKITVNDGFSLSGKVPFKSQDEKQQLKKFIVTSDSEVKNQLA